MVVVLLASRGRGRRRRRSGVSGRSRDVGGRSSSGISGRSSSRRGSGHVGRGAVRGSACAGSGVVARTSGSGGALVDDDTVAEAASRLKRDEALAPGRATGAGRARGDLDDELLRAGARGVLGKRPTLSGMRRNIDGRISYLVSVLEDLGVHEVLARAVGVNGSSDLTRTIDTTDGRCWVRTRTATQSRAHIRTR